MIYILGLFSFVVLSNAFPRQMLILATALVALSAIALFFYQLDLGICR